MELYKEYVLFGALGICFLYAQYLMVEILLRKKTLRDLKKISMLKIFAVILINMVLLVDFMFSSKYELKMFLSIFAVVNIVDFLFILVIYKTKKEKIINDTSSISDDHDNSDFNKTEDLEDIQTVGDNGFDKTQFYKR